MQTGFSDLRFPFAQKYTPAASSAQVQNAILAVMLLVVFLIALEGLSWRLMGVESQPPEGQKTNSGSEFGRFQLLPSSKNAPCALVFGL